MTTQKIKGSVLKSRLEFVRREIGEEGLAKLMEGLPEDNEERFFWLLDRIVHREGIGALLAEGTKAASAQVDAERGTETWKWAMNIKGLECPGYDARALKTFALGLAAGVRGGCHNRSAAYDPDIKGEVDRFSVDETRGELAKSTEEYAAVYDTLPLCTPCSNGVGSIPKYIATSTSTIVPMPPPSTAPRPGASPPPRTSPG